MSRINASVTLFQPRAAEMELETGPMSGALFLTVSDQPVFIALNTSRSDVAAEVAAMERLAELATEAAARLRALADAAAAAMGGERP
ncbi:hypothetical protein [Nonomuraea sp. NPDC050691]|uniref:hypothetical protein n=1 Tax=Nonomuraea sp. NPDC050691 TaxID=3155661 RepID=UPI0033E4FEF8